MANDPKFKTVASAAGAIDLLAARHADATSALRAALERYFDGGPPPTPAERSRFRYPLLRVTWTGAKRPPVVRRAFARFQRPGVYVTSVTQPHAFKRYLMEQLEPLVAEYDATLEVGLSRQEIPYPYVFERGDELGRGNVTAAELARHFPVPLLSQVGDEIADGLWELDEGDPAPLALFDAVRVDYSLRRLVHYTGTDWRFVQPWLLLTNYHRYVDQFLRSGVEELRREGTRFDRIVLPGNSVITRDATDPEIDALIAASPWSRHQMPAYHLTTADNEGVTLVNIGVGPSNAKNITDHLAVLRPHCWLMVGHCGGLRPTQTIGDYVLAHAYLRQDHVLDALIPPDIPIPALAEVQVALQEAAAQVTGDRREALKARLRTGTVVTYSDRNWELRWTQERRRINMSRAIAVDMESGTIAAQGFRLRVPYGTLLCVSDKPLHGEIKLPGAANAFYERAVGEHLQIGLAALDLLRLDLERLHSRKLRSFDEPPFR
jgi:AMP nucleosidase